MHRYIALLRGINVGGHNKVPMAELRVLLTNSGLKQVSTYIQSGNVLFRSERQDRNRLEQDIQKLIVDHFGFEVPIIIKTQQELQTIYNNCPFLQDKKVDSYFVLISDAPDQKLVELASEKKYDHDEYVILNDCIYLHCKKGYGRSKFNLSFFEKQLNVNATARNYKTIVKLLSLSDIKMQ